MKLRSFGMAVVLAAILVLGIPQIMFPSKFSTKTSGMPSVYQQEIFAEKQIDPKPAARLYQDGVIIIVEQGDTLWGLAKTYGPREIDPRRMVDHIRKENRLTTALLHPGQELLIPQNISR